MPFTRLVESETYHLDGAAQELIPSQNGVEKDPSRTRGWVNPRAVTRKRAEETLLVREFAQDTLALLRAKVGQARSGIPYSVR